jgi:hypothetical protein
MKRKISALLLCIALPLPAYAQTHVIAQLGTAPLIGRVASTRQLQTDVDKQRSLFFAAGRGLGLTTGEFALFAQRIARRELTYVVIPRHLDAMTWRSNGRVHVVRDVVIPPDTMGWEVDLREPSRILALFIPNACGNLSLLRKPAPLVAQNAPHVAPRASQPAVQPLMPASPAFAAPPAPAATPAPLTEITVAASPQPAHHLRAWPLLLLPLIAFFASHGHGGGAVTIGSPGALTPTPAPAGCPTPTP